MQYKFLFLLLLPLSFAIKAQQCKVKVSALQGTYQGGCKKKLAHGIGKADGEDSYSGAFKEGYPNGKGKYTWKNGSWYNGYFKNGALDGEGTMHLVISGDKDSVLTGFWKNNVYIGKYEKPYKIHSKTYMVASVNIKSNDKGKQLNEVVINIESVSGGSISASTINKASGGRIPKEELNNILIRKGGYLMQSQVGIMQKSNIYILRDVSFPFHAVLEISKEGQQTKDEVEVEFFTPGSWTVAIKMRQ